MGFFSFKTADTKQSIMNQHTDECKPVYMLQPNGEESILDVSYDGYGNIGGVDVYDWLAQRNGGEGRDFGINLAFSENKPENYVPLKFSFNKDAIYEELPASEDCPRQGYFD